jgi:hypothetical protein
LAASTSAKPIDAADAAAAVGAEGAETPGAAGAEGLFFFVFLGWWCGGEV